MPLELKTKDGGRVIGLTEDDMRERCSFCAKLPSEVAKLVDGPKAKICNECVTLIYENILTAEQRK